MQTFREYMESALYDPERGFYSRRVPSEDFYTAPELHPAFAGVLSREIVKRLEWLKSRGAGALSVVEMGSGSGALAREILRNLRADYPHWAQSARYTLVERTRELMLESVLSLSSSSERVLGYSRLEEMLPCSGVFFSNELVDAFPVHLLEKREGKVREVYVDASGRTSLGEFSTKELEPYAEAVSEDLPEGERHAVNLESARWLRALSQKMKSGFLITIDYGKRFGRTHNPPRTFFRHSTDERVTEAKGFKDITASVDFDLLIQEGRKVGFEMESYATLIRFLLDGGIGDWLLGGSDAAAFKSRNKVKTLLHPEGMGEAFKVLVLRKPLETLS